MAFRHEKIVFRRSDHESLYKIYCRTNGWKCDEETDDHEREVVVSSNVMFPSVTDLVKKRKSLESTI